VAKLLVIGNPMEYDQRITEARARIIWGEAPSSVRAFLISNGVPDTVADAKIKEFNIERNREIRGIGLRRILIGLALLGGAGITFYLSFGGWHGHGWHGHVNGRELAVAVIAGIYGFWKLVNGIFDLLVPRSEHDSIPDMEGED
jgi:hypothetical protein